MSKNLRFLVIDNNGREEGVGSCECWRMGCGEKPFCSRLARPPRICCGAGARHCGVSRQKPRHADPSSQEPEQSHTGLIHRMMVRTCHGWDCTLSEKFPKSSAMSKKSGNLATV